MSTRQLFAFAGLVICCARCSCSPAEITPPRVAEGGRALSIAVTSNNANRLFVTTETGGLFRTFNGGKSWQHLGGLPNFRTVDVAVASLAPETVIATTRSAYRTVNDGGIWRSTDGGGTWSQPMGAMPPPGLGCPSRPSAHGISHMPLSRTFYVGTDCGISVSSDNGATWSFVTLDPTATGSDSGQHRVRSLLVINRSAGVAAADRGLFHLTGNGVWSPSTIPMTGGRVPVLHAFATPWWSGSTSLFLHASGEDQKIWASTDGGATWTALPSPGVNNREAFVRIARSLSNDDNKFDAYIGDGEQFHRQTFSTNSFTPTDNWTQLTIDHVDPSDVAFDLETKTPILLAGDGGVHRTMNSGASWTLTGAGYDGFNALQINEITGQTVSGSVPHLDLYYSTQDNGIKASPDGGQTWPGRAGGEGRHLRISPTSVDHQGTRVTGGKVGSPANFRSGPHFANVTAWPSAPSGNEPDGSEAPFLIVEDAYLQPSFDNSTTPSTFDYFLTLSAGASWAKKFTMPLTPKGPPVFAGSLANPTVYQGVIRSGSVPNGTRFGLMRVRSLATTASVERADSLGLGALGSLRTPIARYMVVGADPRNANHLIAPDLEDGVMKFSADGGTTWYPHTALTTAVTDTGRYLHHVADQSLASVVAWDPYSVCNVLVGTIQNGVIQSKDGGRTWAPVKGTKPVTYISSFFFPPSGKIWISTNGRSLWRLDIDRVLDTPADRCRFPDPPPGGFPQDTGVISDPGGNAPLRIFQGLEDTSVCAGCSVIVVRDGWITDFQVANDTLRQVAISGGTVSQVDRSGREVPLTVPNAYRAGDGRFRGRAVARGIGEARRVRGLVVDGQRLRGVISARDALPFAPSRTPAVFIRSVAPSGSASTVQIGQPVRVTGAGFLPPGRMGQPVRVLFDNGVVAERVPVRGDGTFSVDLPVARSRGEMVVTVEQLDGRRLTLARTIIDLVGTQ